MEPDAPPPAAAEPMDAPPSLEPSVGDDGSYRMEPRMAPGMEPSSPRMEPRMEPGMEPGPCATGV